MTDDELIASVVASGRDPAVVAEETRALLLRVVEQHRATSIMPAPPAVAGGDAPEEGPRCTCPVRPCGACDYDPPRQLRSVNDGPYLKGQAPRRRRQEGQ